jgi:hypothetical protein
MLPQVDVFGNVNIRETNPTLAEYNQITNDVYKEVDCHEEISEAFSELHRLFLTVEGRNKLNSIFA